MSRNNEYLERVWIQTNEGLLELLDNLQYFFFGPQSNGLLARQLPLMLTSTPS